MKDPLFIEKMIQKGKQAGENVKENLGELSIVQLNYKPTDNTWSIGQCLDHLIVADELYYPLFESIADGSYRMTRWEKWSPFSGLFGRLLVRYSGDKVKMKLKAPKKIKPYEHTIGFDIFDRYHQHLDKLLYHVDKCKQVDLDKIRITSPLSGFVTYSLRHAILLVILHNHRHTNQAIDLRRQDDFQPI
jgi:uncharacterized damage-inducible protein DinB